MAGIIGKKIGMTSVYSADGKNLPCTLIEAGPCVVTQIKSEEKDGYNSIQLGFGEKKEKHTTKALKGHFSKAGTSPKKKIVWESPIVAVHYNAPFFIVSLRLKTSVSYLNAFLMHFCFGFDIAPPSEQLSCYQLH